MRLVGGLELYSQLGLKYHERLVSKAKHEKWNDHFKVSNNSNL